MLNYWKQPGDRAFAPALTSPTVTTFTQASTLQLLNGSYMRLKNVTLSYNLPAELLQKSRFISRARVYRSEEHTSELQSLMRISYAVFCLTKKTPKQHNCSQT